MIGNISFSVEIEVVEDRILFLDNLCRFKYPISPPRNHDACKIKAAVSILAGTYDPSVIARDEGRRQSSSHTRWNAILIMKKLERKRRSDRSIGKRFDIARSNVGSWESQLALRENLGLKGALPPLLR